MTLKEFARMLDGRTYGLEITKEEEALAKNLGFVVVFGYSDDNAELRGAINDEIGCFDGGVLKHEDLPDTIYADWCPEDIDCAWAYGTQIPHESFNIYDRDGELYCVGIVCDIGTAKKPMNTNKIKVMLDPGAKMPKRAHPNDAGLDLFAKENGRIPPCGSASFDTGVHMEIPVGYVGLLTSKSGLMSKEEVTSRGTIDSDYRGSIQAILFNHSHRYVHIKAGQKITQLVIIPIITPEPELADELDETERGCGGFGSTGAF